MDVGTRAPVGLSRALGLVGVAGGLALLAAFVPNVPWIWEFVSIRLVLFDLAAIAVAVGVALRLRDVDVSVRVTSVAAGAVIAANAWYLVMIALSTGRPVPPAPDPAFRFVGFLAGAALWWADAVFGLACLRPGVARSFGRLAPIGAGALAIGSVLAFIGMDRLELVRGDLAWLLTPAALTGIALNGVGWILLGLALAGVRPRRTGDRRSDRPAVMP